MKKTKYTIKELVSELNLTYDEFAKENDVSYQSVSKWCRGAMGIAVRHKREIEKKYGVEITHKVNK